jgi:hypothetical protein
MLESFKETERERERMHGHCSFLLTYWYPRLCGRKWSCPSLIKWIGIDSRWFGLTTDNSMGLRVGELNSTKSAMSTSVKFSTVIGDEMCTTLHPFSKETFHFKRKKILISDEWYQMDTRWLMTWKVHEKSE